MANKVVKKHTKPNIIQNIDKSKKQNNKATTNYLYYIIGILVFTLLAYSNSITNDFIYNWDDGGYITEYKVIQNLNFENIKVIWTEFYKGNYHPLTTMFYAFEYNVFGPNPIVFHINNLLFHLANVYLVFFFVKLLTKRIETAIIAAIIMGVHPMHVESVSWISERKDVLYAFFFLLSAISYYYYSTKNKIKYLVYSVILFGLSLLAKSAGTPLPIILILMDFYMKKKIYIDYKLIVSKLAHFALAIGFGVAAILSQDKAGALQDMSSGNFTVFERFLLANYSMFQYLYKLFTPHQFSAMHPYPDKTAGSLPILFYIAPVVIALLVGVYFLIKNKQLKRDYLFGGLFFGAMIALVLQFVPVGGAIIAERYTYIPYVGLSIIIGQLYCYVKDNHSKWTNIMKIAFIIYAIAFAVITFNRNFDWKRGDILFTDVIDKYPNMAFAYNNRGYFYQSHEKNFYKALEDYNTSLKVDPTFHRALSNRGVVYFNIAPEKKDSANFYYQMAIIDFKKAIEHKSNNTDALLGLANTYSQIGQFKESLPYYSAYMKEEKENQEAYLWRGTAYNRVDSFDLAIKDYEYVLKLNKNNDEAYFRIGVVYFDIKQYDKAIEFIDKSIQLNKDNQSIASQKYSYRGFANYYLKKYEDAANDLHNAVKINPKDIASYTQRAIVLQAMNRFDLAIDNYTEAIKNNPSYIQFINDRYRLNLKLKRYGDAYEDLKLATNLGINIPKSEFASVEQNLKKRN
ncbi:MAG: hypothetical protein A2X12_12265 [Bacteroidetes bacterium GWE2_29_8]|nr:MAG: hypothetical protein A2X12_12265 [Bacteroidetes bacterium GWE2_29_8]OFY20469.1 MAG: hypothetical protein A2X02_02425 [Bacteroidetes bacterium GWF2_29_10]